MSTTTNMGKNVTLKLSSSFRETMVTSSFDAMNAVSIDRLHSVLSCVILRVVATLVGAGRL